MNSTQLPLPDSVQEIADVIGREQALKLIGELPRRYVGREGGKSRQVIMYVPKRLPVDHQLVRILGWEDAKRMCNHFGGEILKPASCAEIRRAERNTRIVSMASDGTHAVAIAKAIGVSERLVRNVLKEIPPEARRPAANDNAASYKRAAMTA